MARRIAVAVALIGGGSSLLSVAQGCTSNETTCSSFLASNYDQSCKVDSDCVVVQELGFCCPGGIINVAAQAQYTADVDKAPAACAAKACNVSCPTAGAACCRQGTCQLVQSQCIPARTEDAAGADADGPAACVAAGGECLVGGSSSVCAVVGPQDCNPDRNPGGQYCCLKKAGVADAATDGGGADADACAPSGCNTACPAGTHDVSSMVNGCLIWQCCVPDEAAADAMTDGGPADAAGE